ncbi:MAG: cation transporter [Desulfovibrio sp.]|nr:cation transporter [Desulfovibrio sp.]MBI4959041.1 cation transporter [Desulfovibrio sp.]
MLDHTHTNGCCTHGHDHHGERGAKCVFWLTVITMAAEIVAGWAYGSMALLADGWHMASHAGAMAVAWFAYAFARKQKNNPELVFGSGKVNALAGFASSIGLGLVAVFMGFESVMRLVSPVTIEFTQATVVAVLGLLVNLASAWLLRDEDHLHSQDHNLKAAYLHVLADALTSILAIIALLGGRYFGYVWLDPLMGVAGSLVVGRWAYGLLANTAKVLLDHSVDRSLLADMRARVEKNGDTLVRDLAAWRVGPRSIAVQLTVEDPTPRHPAHYKGLLAGVAGLERITVEVHTVPSPLESQA